MTDKLELQEMAEACHKVLNKQTILNQAIYTAVVFLNKSPDQIADQLSGLGKRKKAFSANDVTNRVDYVQRQLEYYLKRNELL